MGTVVTIAMLLAGGLTGYAGLNFNVSANTKKNTEQDRAIEKIEDAAHAADVQRGRIEQDVKNTLRILERLERKMDGP